MPWCGDSVRGRTAAQVPAELFVRFLSVSTPVSAGFRLSDLLCFLHSGLANVNAHGSTQITPLRNGRRYDPGDTRLLLFLLMDSGGRMARQHRCAVVRAPKR